MEQFSLAKTTANLFGGGLLCTLQRATKFETFSISTVTIHLGETVAQVPFSRIHLAKQCQQRICAA